MSSLTSGQTLDARFTLVRPLGRGGMGEVWLVEDGELGEEVVAKILPADASEDQVALLRRECSHARRLVHPNIVRVFEFHRSALGAFITMAHVDGNDLRSWRGREAPEVIRGLLPVVDALRYAHARGVVHRDLKPANLVCDSTGSPQLLDFGIARFGSGAERISGGGSRAYASPQQRRGDDAEPADDLYGLGALIHDLLTGEPPSADSASSSAIAGPLGALVSRLLAEDRAARPRDMAEVERELREILREEQGPAAGDARRVAVTPPPRVQPIRRVKPELRSPRAPSPRRFPRVGLTGVMATLVVLTALALLVIPEWLGERLPAEVAATSTPNPDAPDPAAQSEPLDEPAPDRNEALRERLRLRREAERELGEVGTRIEALTNRNVAAWGGGAYAAVLGQLSIADERLAGGDFEEAGRLYQEAAGALDALVDRSRTLVGESLERGAEALGAGDAATAIEAFETVLIIEPENAAARTGHDRASVLEPLLQLMESGGAAEREGDLPLAERSYARAVTLDPLHAQAQLALGRVQSAIREDRFAREMSDGLQALERGEFATAREAFERAGVIRPDSTQVAAGLARLEEAERVEAILRHRDLAQRLESNEEWPDAQREFERVLALDPSVLFAQEGAARCAVRAELARQIEFALDNPERLSDDRVLDRTKTLLDQVERVQPQGPKHRARVERLRELVRSASTYVRVRLESDSQTEVTVYRIGRLGTFESHEFELRPGRYTIVGSRRGFRDVRRELVVTAEGEPEPLVIRCEEPI